ncbi:MAG: hypothetical protein ACYDGM_10515 [Vulcanimicrobiaceae bacterium]
MRITALMFIAIIVTIVGLRAPALADISAAGGAYATDAPSQVGGAVIFSTAESIPALPIQIQASLLLPATKQGGYALTAEIRGLSGGGFGGAYVGAGLGVGTLSSSRTPGPVLTVFAGKPIAPFTTIEVRIYRGTQNNGTTAGFLGVRFSI